MESKRNILPDIFKRATIWVMIALAGCSNSQAGIPLTGNGKSSYSIVIPAAADKLTKKAAAELQQYIKQITGATLSIKEGSVSSGGNIVLVGNHPSLKQAGTDLGQLKLGDDGFIIRTRQQQLIIAGITGRGTLYGVYSFLETYLGVRIYTATVKKLPRQPTVTLKDINDVQIPVIKYRDLYYEGAYDPTFSDWHKLDHFDGSRGHEDQRLWGEIWSSSFIYVIPQQKYFKSNPEYFALYKNSRTPDQLCLTNERMFTEYMANFKKMIQRNPDSKVWSVAPNDFLEENYCHCNRCEAINQKAGSPMGTLLTFTNKVAAALPNLTIATQAYLHYEEPPKGIKPAPNVMIVECGPYFLSKSWPYSSNQTDENKTFNRRLNEWLALTKNIRIWDYITDFPYLMAPFPNFSHLQENMRFFAKQKGITNIFMQGNIAKGGEFAELRTYLVAKLLWNPDIKVDAVMTDFLNNFYGKAGIHLKQYIDAMTQELARSGKPLLTTDHPHKHYDDYLSPAMIRKYNTIFDNAEKSVAGDKVILDRVKIARLPLIFTQLEASKMVNNTVKAKAALNREIGNRNKDVLALLDYFVNTCRKAGIIKLAEYPTTIDSYRQTFIQYTKDTKYEF